MYKIFISQPMKNKSRRDIIAERIDVVRYVEDVLGKGNFTIVDSLFDEPMHDDINPLWDLGRSIQLLSTADVAFFAPGWIDSRGCRIEHQCAIEYGIPTYEM